MSIFPWATVETIKSDIDILKKDKHEKEHLESKVKKYYLSTKLYLVIKY